MFLEKNETRKVKSLKAGGRRRAADCAFVLLAPHEMDGSHLAAARFVSCRRKKAKKEKKKKSKCCRKQGQENGSEARQTVLKCKESCWDVSWVQPAAAAAAEAPGEWKSLTATKLQLRQRVADKQLLTNSIKNGLKTSHMEGLPNLLKWFNWEKRPWSHCCAQLLVVRPSQKKNPQCCYHVTLLC